MTAAATPAAPVQGKMFLRQATGLVREVSLLDAFIMNTFGMNVAVGAVFLFLQAPADFPNGNMLLAVVIGTLLMAFTLLWVYSTFSAAMPRSGGSTPRPISPRCRTRTSWWRRSSRTRPPSASSSSSWTPW